MPQARMLCQPSTGHHSTASALNSVSTTCSVRVRHGAAISGRAHPARGGGTAPGTPRRRAAEPPPVCFPVRGGAGRAGPGPARLVGGSAGGAAPARPRRARPLPGLRHCPAWKRSPAAQGGLAGTGSSRRCRASSLTAVG